MYLRGSMLLAGILVSKSVAEDNVSKASVVYVQPLQLDPFGVGSDLLVRPPARAKVVPSRPIPWVSYPSSLLRLGRRF